MLVYAMGSSQRTICRKSPIFYKGLLVLKVSILLYQLPRKSSPREWITKESVFHFSSIFYSVIRLENSCSIENRLFLYCCTIFTVLSISKWKHRPRLWETGLGLENYVSRVLSILQPNQKEKQSSFRIQKALKNIFVNCHSLPYAFDTWTEAFNIWLLYCKSFHLCLCPK